MKTYLFGDVGGHSKQFFAALEDIGVDLERKSIPSDVRIVQVGDLIHKGPSTTELVEVVDALMYANSEQWVQLLGNHEFQHLGGFRFWNCDCDRELVHTLRKWRKDRMIKNAFAFTHEPTAQTNVTQTLVTHAGLTFSNWKHMAPFEDAMEVAAALNAGLDLVDLASAGVMMGKSARSMASPIWAASTIEVYPGWVDTVPMPFNQVHGHTIPYEWSRREWFDKRTPKLYSKSIRVNERDRFVWFNPGTLSSYGSAGSGVFFGIDPGFAEREPNIVKQPFLLL